jgi:2-succinyl-6-hydroxy-2,4-cyclohexadiene-1-carboxylate synthase
MISLTMTRVLFVPGFMQRGDAWRPVAELLPERYPSVLLDHAEHTLEGRLAEIADAGEGSVLAGYSLGGRLALRAALREPARYTGLVTIGATAGIEDAAARGARREADERLAAWIEGASIEDVVAVWERQPLFADQSDALVEAQRAGRLNHDPSDLAALLRTAGQGVLEPVWHELPGLALPVLAVAGARDERYSEAARRTAEAAPRGRAAIVTDAGHAPQLQRPSAVAGVLIELFDKLD